MGNNFLKLLLSKPKAADEINLRKWFFGYLLYLATLAGWSLACYGYFLKTSNNLAAGMWLLGLYMFYMSLCCTFLPLPTAWAVMLMASQYTLSLLGLPAAMGAIMVAAIGAICTGLANLNEYHIFTFLLRFRQIDRLRKTRLYNWAANWFSVSPFLLVMVASFIPIPIDIVRWLAIAYRYSRRRFFAAYVLGRFIRYTALAMASALLQLTLPAIAIIQAVLIILALSRFLLQLIKRGVSHEAETVKE